MKHPDLLQACTRAIDDLDAAVAAAEAARLWRRGHKRGFVALRTERIFNVEAIAYRKEAKLPTPKTSVQMQPILPVSAVARAANALYGRLVNYTHAPPRALVKCKLPVGPYRPEVAKRKRR